MTNQNSILQKLAISAAFSFGFVSNIFGAEILFKDGEQVHLLGESVPNRFDEQNQASTYRGAKGDYLVPELRSEYNLGYISFWAKLESSMRVWDDFDVLVLSADTQPLKSLLRFRFDGFSDEENSLITISAGRHLGFRGNWFFDQEGNPRWFHVVLLPDYEHPVLYVNGEKIDGYDSKYHKTGPEHQNPVWSNWNGEAIVITKLQVSNDHKFIGAISDIRIGSNPLIKAEIDSLFDGEDSDGDGLGDWFEYQRGMDRFSIDTDSDGLTDFEEMGYDNTYEFVKNTCSWPEASVIAQEKGGYLAVVTSQSENQKVVNYLKSFSRRGTFIPYNTWLGASDTKIEGKWKWVTGEPWFFTNWMPNEPNNLGNEDHLYVVKSSPEGEWNDFHEYDPNHTQWEARGLLVEYGYASNPLLADTDGDGLSDSEEASLNTNPFLNSSKLLQLDIEGGVISLNRKSGLYENGSLVIAEAIPQEGFAFVRWVGAVDSIDNPAYWEFSEGQSIAPIFTPAPTILGQPQDKAVPFNGVGSLLVVAKNITEPSNGPIGYQWIKDDAILEGETGPVLFIDNMTLEKEGTYKVEVSSGSATVSSAAAYVSIIMPLEIESIPQTLYLESGTRDFRYEVKLNNNIELQNIVWYRDMIVIPDLETAVYEDGLITSRDNGVYSIYATDGITEVRGDVFTIQAVSGPQIKEISVKTDKASFSFYAAEGNTYEVYKSEDLENWDLVWSTQGSGEEVVFVDDEGLGFNQRFFKVMKK